LPCRYLLARDPRSLDEGWGGLMFMRRPPVAARDQLAGAPAAATCGLPGAPAAACDSPSPMKPETIFKMARTMDSEIKPIENETRTRIGSLVSCSHDNR
jgi:hypothetical protein